MEREADKEVILAGVQAGEANTGDGNEAGFLREHLDIAKDSSSDTYLRAVARTAGVDLAKSAS